MLILRRKTGQSVTLMDGEVIVTVDKVDWDTVVLVIEGDVSVKTLEDHLRELGRDRRGQDRSAGQTSG